MNDVNQIAIVGSGPAGYTAAIYAARAGLNPIVFEGFEWGGQLMITTDVENYPGFPDGIHGPPLMEAFRKQAEKFGARLDSRTITAVDFNERPLKLYANNDAIEATAVVLATGAVNRKLGVVGEEQYTARGLSYCATCDGFFFKDKHIAVIGGGDSAMEEAIFLTKFGSKVTIIHRRDEFRASKIMQERALAHPKIEVRYNAVATEIRGDEKALTHVVLKDTKTEAVDEMEVGGVFVAVGHDPATSIFKGVVEMDDNGYIKVDHPYTNTNISGVFAAGDCVDHIYRQAITAAGMGCAASIDAERWLSALES